MKRQHDAQMLTSNADKIVAEKKSSRTKVTGATSEASDEDDTNHAHRARMEMLDRTTQYWNRAFDSEDKSRSNEGDKAIVAIDSSQQTEEWLATAEEVIPIVAKHAKMDSRILIVGCGSSPLSEKLFSMGYTQLTSVDISDVVINKMQSLNPHMKWMVADCTNLHQFGDGSFDIVLDKGTLDTMFFRNRKENRKLLATKMLNEVFRTLAAPNGKYLIVSPRRRIPLLHSLAWTTTTTALSSASGLAHKSGGKTPVKKRQCYLHVNEKARGRQLSALEMHDQRKARRCQLVSESQSRLSSLPSVLLTVSETIPRCLASSFAPPGSVLTRESFDTSSEKYVCLKGTVLGLRKMSRKLMFLDITDGPIESSKENTLQLVWEEPCFLTSLWARRKLIDVGDTVIGLGLVGKTQTGTPAILCHDFLLTGIHDDSIHPRPKKF